MVAVARPSGAPVQSRPRLLFSQVAQDYTAPVGAIPYDGGTRNPNPINLLPDGYLDRLNMVATLTGQYGTAGPTATDPLALFSGPIERIEMVGTNNRGLYNLTGEFAGIFTYLDRLYSNAAATQASLVSGAGFNGVALPGVAAFADQWYFDLPLGLQIREFDGPIGLYPVGFVGPPPRINVYFRPVNATTANPGTGVYVPAGTSTGPTPAGTFDVSQHGFAPIAVDGALPPANLVRTFREGAVVVNGNQTYTVEFMQGAFVTRIVFFTVANGAMANISAITNLEYDYGFGMRRKQYNGLQVANLMNRRYGSATLPNWLGALDFISDTHSMRDWINTTAVTRPRMQLALAGLTYGGAQNQIRFGVEEIFPYPTAVQQSIR